MKKKLTTFIFLTTVISAFISCKNKVKEEIITSSKTPTVEQVTGNFDSYLVNVNESYIDWKGTKPTGEHFGTIALKEGHIAVSNKKIINGTFVIDMNTIIVTDIPLEEESNAKLLNHLKYPDFFDVENHQTSGFKITDLAESETKTIISGDLTIKGITHNITFPVTVNYTEEQVIITSDTFVIDRTKWNIKYKSKSIFGDLGDKFINDNIEFKISIKANRA